MAPRPKTPKLRSPKVLPGPPHLTPIPDPLPRGIMPPEKSAMWCYTSKAVQQGEDIIGADTVEWLVEQGGEVVICRDYPTHPRWKLGQTRQEALANRNVVAEIHMLARRNAGLAVIPDWARHRLTTRLVQNEAGFQLVKSARKIFTERADETLREFRDRNPGAFLKFVADLVMPKQIDHTHVVIDPLAEANDETLRAMLLEVEAKLTRAAKAVGRAMEDSQQEPLTYVPLLELEPGNVRELMRETGQDLLDQSGLKPAAATAIRKMAPEPPAPPTFNPDEVW